MKRISISLLALLALTMPSLAHAQSSIRDRSEFGPPPYNDVDDGQLLRLAAYVLAPVGYALEWTVTRPLHHLATDTVLAPVLSGDTNIRYFGETANASRLPANTFVPFVMPANPNALDSDVAANTYPRRSSNVLPPVPPARSHRGPSSSYGRQPALH
jgi:hypothetical protein